MMGGWQQSKRRRSRTIDSIARHLTCFRTEDAEPIPNDEMLVSRDGEQVLWHVGRRCGVLALADLIDVKLATVTHGPNRFAAVVATFRDKNVQAGYCMIVGPEAEAAWFNETVAKLRRTIWPDQNSQN